MHSTAHRRSTSGSSILSKFSFMRSSSENTPRQMLEDDSAQPTPRAAATIIQQQKTRRRRGSLRKVALLGRGAQRDRKDSKALTIDTSHATTHSPEASPSEPEIPAPDSYLGTNTTQEAQMGNYMANNDATISSISPTAGATQADRDANSTYTSTDEEDLLQIPRSSTSLRSGLSTSSGSESYYNTRGPAVQRGRSIQHVKSPLSYSGLSSTPLPPPDSDWDYSETEWWGWVVLSVTWFGFVIGMGSCFNIWSWAWDVGKTPYAPPELEDDPTLPIVGYYPALIILTCIMAWVWVVVAWVGMKYFRHAKISGD